MRCVDCRNMDNCKDRIYEPELRGCASGIPAYRIKYETYFEKIKSMSIEEMAESRIDRIDIYCKSDTQMWTGDFSGIAENKKEALQLEKEWLENEVEE